jgi:hypothetical protein
MLRVCRTVGAAKGKDTDAELVLLKAAAASVACRALSCSMLSISGHPMPACPARLAAQVQRRSQLLLLLTLEGPQTILEAHRSLTP